MRIALSALLVLALQSAHASFDLCLVSDSGTDSVHRIDPITGAYLGSFGGGFLVDPKGVAIDQSINTAYVIDGSRLSLWNYNTGEFKTSFNIGEVGTSLTRASDGTLLVASAFGLHRYSTTGVLSLTYGSGVVDAGILGPDGQIYVASGTNTLNRYKLTTGALIGTQSWQADRFAYLNGDQVLNAYGATFLEVDTLNNGATASTSPGTSLLTSATGVAAGHGGMAFMVGTTATANVGGLVREDMNTGTFGTLIGTAYLQNPTGLANVVAPEPGTLAGIATALGMLTLRRRRK